MQYGELYSTNHGVLNPFNRIRPIKWVTIQGRRFFLKFTIAAIHLYFLYMKHVSDFLNH